MATEALKPGFKLKSKERTYEIVKVLGSGSFGITYLAKADITVGNISIQGRFAIKEHFLTASCFRADNGASVNAVPSVKSEVVGSRQDFVTEANRLKEICNKSRSIVSVNEVFEANGTAYYVMEYLDGGNPGLCSEKEAIDIVLQVAEALKAIHNENLLHLDVKPDNIVMKTNDKNETYPVLIDFGIAKHFDSKGRPTSNFNARGASPGYAPQEQYAGVSKFSPKYDIYALGAVLFYLVTGQNPPEAFQISPNQQELKKELEGKVSPATEAAILDAMKPNAAERTATIQEFCDRLKGIERKPAPQADTSIPTKVLNQKNDDKASGGTTILTHRPSWLQRNRRSAVIGAAAVIVAGGIVALCLAIPSGDRDSSEALAAAEAIETPAASFPIDTLPNDAAPTVVDDEAVVVETQEQFQPETTVNQQTEQVVKSQSDTPVKELATKENPKEPTDNKLSAPQASSSSKQLYTQGKKMMNEGKFADGWKLVLEAANNGYGPAQDEAGSMYYNGHIDANDNFVGNSKFWGEAAQRKGYEWFKKAAAQNVGFSQLMLGDAYLSGKYGFPRDTVTAVKWYKKARANGNKRWADQALEGIPAKYK